MECSTSFLNTKTAIYYFDLDLKGLNNSHLIFRSVPVRTILFFTNCLERLKYEKRKKWIEKIHGKIAVPAEQVFSLSKIY